MTRREQILALALKGATTREMRREAQIGSQILTAILNDLRAEGLLGPARKGGKDVGEWNLSPEELRRRCWKEQERWSAYERWKRAGKPERRVAVMRTRAGEAA